MRNFPLRRLRWLLVAVPLSLTASCGAVNAASRPEPVPPAPRIAIEEPSQTPTPTPTPPPKKAPPPEPAPREARPIASAVVESAARKVEPNTTVGAVVLDREGGGKPLAVNPDRQFRSASLVKLLIAVDALEQGADQEDRQRLARMLAASDDDVASSYWVLGGRPDIVLRMSVQIGLTGTEPPEDPGMWGEVLLTPNDVARIYQYVLAMPAPDRTLIVDALAQAPRVADDGFDQYFGIPDGLRTSWAIKQGWGNNSSAMVLHSTGLAGPNWRYIVVLLTEHPLGSGWQTSAESVTAAAASLHGHLPGV
jgi:hypothetical protein